MFNFLFGKKTTKRRSKKKSTKSKQPAKSLISKCKKMGVRVTKKVGNKRVYKSALTLEKQCKSKKRTVKKSKVVSGTSSPKMTLNRKNVLKKKMRAAAIALGGLKILRKNMNNPISRVGLPLVSVTKPKIPTPPPMPVKKEKFLALPAPPKKMTLDRRNVIKKKIMAAARMSRLLKSSRVALNQRYPGDKLALLNPDAPSKKMSPERKKMIKNKILAAAKLMKKKDNNQLRIFNAYPTKGSPVSYEKKNNFGKYYYH